MKFNVNTNKAPSSTLGKYLHTLDQEVGNTRFTLSLLIRF